MPFRSDIRRWATPDEFRAHLDQHNSDIASWAHGIVIHHTLRPDTSDWRGIRSMYALKAYYSNLGWDAGPHLFLACHSLNPNNNGIYQLTALNEKGIHATTANRTMWGIEVVGNFDHQPWSSQQRDLLYSVVTHLLQWRGISDISRATLLGHREVPSQKTCPGSMINMDIVRAELQERMRGSK